MPITTIHVVPSEGHVHLYLDGSIVAMTGLEASLSVAPGTHTLRAEFAASDHGPFRPPVTAEVTFEVTPQIGGRSVRAVTRCAVGTRNVIVAMSATPAPRP